MTSYPGYDPALGGERRTPALSGAEPQLGGEQRINLSLLDMLSRGLWTSAEELRRVIQQIPSGQRSLYVGALLARLEIADPDKRLPEVAPWRGGRDQRVRIIVSLGVLGDPSVCDALARLLQDENAEVRQCAMNALGRLSDPRAVPPLLNILGSSDHTIHDRVAAAEALAAIRSADAVPGLIECLDVQRGGMVHRRIVHALGRTGGEEALWAVVDVLQHCHDSATRQEAAHALGLIDDMRALLYLAEALDDPSADVRYACIQAIQHFQGPIVRAAVGYGLSDPDERVRAAAATARRVLAKT